MNIYHWLAAKVGPYGAGAILIVCMGLIAGLCIWLSTGIPAIVAAVGVLLSRHTQPSIEEREVAIRRALEEQQARRLAEPARRAAADAKIEHDAEAAAGNAAVNWDEQDAAPSARQRGEQP